MAGALSPSDLVRPVLIQTPLGLPWREPRPRGAQVTQQQIGALARINRPSSVHSATLLVDASVPAAQAIRRSAGLLVPGSGDRLSCARIRAARGDAREAHAARSLP